MKITTISMKICSNLRVGRFLTAIVAICAVALSGGCSLTEDSSLGYNMLPENQKMVMRHLTFKGNKVISFDAENSTADESRYKESTGHFFETSLYRTDSLISCNVAYGYFGVERSDTFGMRSAAFATSMMYGNSLPDTTNGFGYLPIFDTLTLHLSIDDYCGDTLVPVRYTIYELNKPLLGSIINSEDSTAYVNCDLSQSYDASKPLFTFTFPDGTKTGPSTASVNLTPSDMSENGATWDFVRRLMLIPEDRSEWDGYANADKKIYQKEADFAEKFNGVCIVPDESSVPADKRGAMFNTNLALTGFTLEGRSRNPEDPTLIKDTVGMTYYFSNSLSEPTWSANSIKHDYSAVSQPLSGSKTLRDIKMAADDGSQKIDRSERDLVQTCMVEGMAGPMTELYFTDEFIDALRAVAAEQDIDGKGYSAIGINQCLVCLYIAKADYDWMVTQGNAAMLTPYLNASVGRLGMFSSFDTMTAIADYDYATEQTSGTMGIYDGNLNRSRACYVMDISGYMQGLVNYALTLSKGADGKYTFNENDKGYTPRTIYVGPEAVSPFTFKRSLLQGMAGEENAAPIQIQLTYTLFK